MRNRLAAVVIALVALSCAPADDSLASGGSRPTSETRAAETNTGWSVVHEVRVDRNQMNLYAVASSIGADFAQEAEACANQDKSEGNERYCWLYPTLRDFDFADVPADGSSVGRQCWVAFAGAGVSEAKVSPGELNEYMAPNCPSYDALFPPDPSMSPDEQVCSRYVAWYLGVSDESEEAWAQEMRRLADQADSERLRGALLAEADHWAAGEQQFDSDVSTVCREEGEPASSRPSSEST